MLRLALDAGLAPGGFALLQHRCGLAVVEVVGDPVAAVRSGRADVGAVAASRVLDDGLVIGAIPARTGGQVTLLLLCRYEDGPTRLALAPLHDFATAVCVGAERAFSLAWAGDGPATCRAGWVGDGRVAVCAEGAGLTETRVVEADEAEDTARSLAETWSALPDR